MHPPAGDKTYRALPAVRHLPYALYRADELRALDRAALDESDLTGADLMERAGQAAYRLIRSRWSSARSLTVLCGGGNNAGDGYVVARAAVGHGDQVRVLTLVDPARLRGDALAMAQVYRAAGGAIEPFAGLPQRTDLIVDALLGIGLARDLEGPWLAAVQAVNAHRAPVLALDVPSGLDADTGAMRGDAVRASATISFIGLKVGFFTGEGPERCGRIHFAGLEIPATTLARVLPSARRIDWRRVADRLGPRPRTAHKGTFGHVLIIGGAPGFSGAVRLAGEAALRAGAGLVSIATHPDHARCLNLTRPELMVHAVDTAADLAPLLERATVVAIGPGLGQGAWGRDLWLAVVSLPRPLIVDADALNLLAEAPAARADWVLTPHPGEAARLLGESTVQVQRDRPGAVSRLQRRYLGVVVLKGAGTLIDAGPPRPPAICSDGNPGLASGGTGDALTGIIAALVAQGLDPDEAASVGVCVHARAADVAARDGERGMLAGDLIARLRAVLDGQDRR
ncbi:NAD(P)H-hydrate dehydratase [Thioalkalicoccus limnaeus]|uniref:Bifunctional NAD(P)H-hydrate repair enzyme n=1 Tax=Thioalkalicoccus limnaeus TaxID=120681 RepID=A0ABV4BDQ0_9GAMM